MKLKHLESSLSKCTREFSTPKVELEQYPTSAHLAAWVGLTALENDDIGKGRSCLDLGCGTAMLLISCAILGTGICYGVDCDVEAIQIATSNIDYLHETGDLLLYGGGTGRDDDDDDDDDDTTNAAARIEMILAKLRPLPQQSSSSSSSSDNTTKHNPKSKGKRGGGRGGRGRGGRRGGGGGRPYSTPQVPPPPSPLLTDKNDDDDYNDGIPLRSNLVDTVITNPPFGTKQNAGMDVQFLRCSIRLATKAVYSFHKTTTRQYLIKTLKGWGLTDVKVVAQMKFDIPQMYKFHQKKSVDVEVDLLRIGIPPSSQQLPQPVPKELIPTNDDDEHNPDDDNDEAG